MVKSSRREKPDEKLTKSFSPNLKNKSQKLAWELWPNLDVLFLIGQAGTGKTHTAACLAMRDFLSGESRGVYLIRAAVEAAGESLGYLPGDLNNKVGPYSIPIKQEIEQLCIENSNPRPDIETVPVAMARGRNFLQSVVIIDEAQNLTKKQFLLLMTRMCVGTKYVVCGDPAQTDIEDSFYARAVEVAGELPGVGIIRFTPQDNTRHKLVPEFIRVFTDA